jgi:hypothetical protein
MLSSLESSLMDTYALNSQITHADNEQFFA